MSRRGWGPRAGQGQVDAQENGHRECTSKLGCRGAFLSPASKVQQETSHVLCISPNPQGHQDPTLGNWDYSFPTPEPLSRVCSRSSDTESP